MGVLSCVISVGAAAAHPTWEEYKALYSKYYNGNDEDQRRLTYQASLKIIDEHNAKGLSFRLGVNQFADMTADEYKNLFLSGLTGGAADAEEAAFNADLELPDRVDWREVGAVTPVKDQGTCGSCWAFSTTGAIEGAEFLSSGNLISLSEEELLDCAKGNGNKGCRGGEPDVAMEWVKSHGLCTEEGYPYNMLDFECLNKYTPCQVAVNIDGYQSVQKHNEAALKAAVAQQPVSVEIQANSDLFRLYESGVLSGDGCGTFLDHAVLVVGYGNEDGQDYWLVKNSWNKTWGDEGYVKLARTDSTSTYGMCGIAQKMVYPTISAASALV